VDKQPLLQVDGIVRTFGGLKAVDGASFQVPAGQVTGLIGPNGAGKSTVINVVSGAMKPDGGSIRFDGQEIAGRPSHEVARLGLIRTFQRTNLFLKLTVMENLMVAVPRMPGDTLWEALLGKRFWRASEDRNHERLLGLLARLGLSRYEDRYAGELSGGEKRLVELARALAAKPRLLILDEPMSGINPALAPMMVDHIRGLAAEGTTVLVIEHELAFVEAACELVIVMAQGQVLAQGRMSDLRHNKDVVNAYLS
jgi:branched-chain amino acid transport system ATP-binding protein